jgi:type IV pilus assembly protein PilE
MLKKQGFTLIELVIVVAIIGILAAIAYPSYQDSVRKSRRADAKEVLLEGAQWMERFYTENYRYDQNKTGISVGDLFPDSLKASPKEGTTKYYQMTFSASTANAFTLQATPTTQGGQDKDPCGALTLTNTGAKGVLGTGATVANCW